jgi:hypothetical protein
MRAVAGALLVLAAVILLSAVLVSHRLSPRTDPDAWLVNLVLVVGSFALGLFGLVVTVTGLGPDRPAARGPAAQPRAPA